MRLGRAMCFPPHVMLWWQALSVTVVTGPVEGSLAMAGVGL
jgi:hypothetical protein